MYVEKPLAMDMKELLSAVDIVKRSNRVAMRDAGATARGSSVAGRALLDSGGLGKLFKIEQSRNSLHPYWDGGAARPVAESDVDWKAFLMTRKYRPWNADQYAGWMGYREFSRGTHTQFMAHFMEPSIHFVTGASYPERVVAIGRHVWLENARTTPDSIEVTSSKEGLVRSSAFGTNTNSFLKFFGNRGVMDATRWSNPWVISGEGLTDPDRVAAGGSDPGNAEHPAHEKLVRLHAVPAAARRTHRNRLRAFGGMPMAGESFVRGRRMVHDPAKRQIREG